MYFALDTPNELLLFQTIKAHIRASTPNQNWLALVDTAFDHGFKGVSWKGLKFPVYYLNDFKPLANTAPTLLVLDVYQEEVFNRQLSALIKHCAGRPMLSFIQSKVSAEIIREHWQTSLAPMTEDGQRMLLRFADTRINENLPIDLLPNSWGRFTAVLEQWLIIDRMGALKPLKLSNVNQSLNPFSQWKLNQQEFNALLTSAQPDALVDALSEHYTELLPALNRADFYHTIKEVCDLADKYQIEAFPEVMSLALAVITSATPIQHDEKLNSWLAAHAWKTGEFTDALMQFLEKE